MGKHFKDLKNLYYAEQRCHNYERTRKHLKNGTFDAFIESFNIKSMERKIATQVSHSATLEVTFSSKQISGLE